MNKKTKTEMTISIDIEVDNIIKQRITPLINKSAYVNNLLRKALNLTYIEINEENSLNDN